MRCDYLPLAIAMFAGAAWGQNPGVVEGVVTDRATVAPVKKALVTLRAPSGGTGYQALSDAAGHFRIEGVKPGAYALWGEAQGYLQEMARFGAPAQAVKVEEDQTVRERSIRLQPLGVISGRVTDANGEPVADADLDAMRYTYSARVPSLTRFAVATTDDRGEFRAFNLEPGRWYLRVNKTTHYAKASGRVHRAMPDMDYPETFYPGVGRAEEAAPLTLAPGAELSQIEIRLRKQRTYRVRGKVVDGRSGEPAVGVEVRIEGQGTVESHAGGLFDARAIPPGPHRISASLRLNGLSLQAAWQEIVVGDRDTEGVALRLEPTGSLSGMAVVDSGAPLTGGRVTLEPLGGLGEMERAPIAAAGRFTVPYITAQAYRLSVDQLPAGMYLKSAIAGA